MAIKLSRRKFLYTLTFGITALTAPILWKGRRALAFDKAIDDRPNFDDNNLKFFSPEEYLLIYDISERIIPPEGERGPGASDVKLANRLDDFIFTEVDPEMRLEFRDFLDLFSSLSDVVKGAPFSELTQSQQDDYINFWQTFPSLSLIRGGFLTLKRVITATFFDTEEAWEYIDYGGSLNIYIDPFRR